MYNKGLNATRIKMFSRVLIIFASVSFLFLKDKSLFNFLIGLVGLYYLYDLTFYLPFLDTTYFPDITVPFQSTATETVEIKNLPPNTRVVYWAASTRLNGEVYENPLDAYKDSNNKGYVLSDSEGTAVLLLDCPSVYKVGKFMKKELPKHVHYRYELAEFPGLYSRVFTKNMEC